MKVLKPLPHAIIDYAWAGAMIAAPWVFGFHKNRRAKVQSVSSGAAIIGLSLMTRYPLGAAKLIPFPVHGVIETISGAVTASAPWLLGYSNNERAKWTHVISGLSTFMVVALTDYQAAEAERGRRLSRRNQRFMPGERGAGLAQQMRDQTREQEEPVDLGPPSHFAATARPGDKDKFSPV